MRIFFKRKSSVAPSWWVELDRLQKKYAHRLADWLARKTARVPARRLRVWVIAFLLGLAGIDLMITMFSLRDHHGMTPVVIVPAAAIPPPRLAQPPRLRWSLEGYLDSLRHDPVGSRLLDSLLTARPGLADTLRELEKMTP